MRGLLRPLRLGLLVSVLAAGAHAATISGTMYYTTFQNQGTANITNNVVARDWRYDTAAHVFSTSTVLWSRNLIGADGIIFARDGNLLVGQQAAGTVVELKAATGADAAGPFPSGAVQMGAYHLSRDTHGDGLDLYVSGSYAPSSSAALGHIVLSATGTSLTSGGVALTTTAGGQPILIDSLEWANGSVYYTSSDPSGSGGSFGTIDLATGVATPLCGAGARSCAADGIHPHGLSYDPFTSTLIVAGGNTVSQYDPFSATWVVTGRVVTGALQFDQGETDALGHLFLADNVTGNLFFFDYGEGSGATNLGNALVTSVFLASSLDDITVLNDPQDAPTHSPEPGTAALCGFALLAAGAWRLRRR